MRRLWMDKGADGREIRGGRIIHQRIASRITAALIFSAFAGACIGGLAALARVFIDDPAAWGRVMPRSAQAWIGLGFFFILESFFPLLYAASAIALAWIALMGIARSAVELRVAARENIVIKGSRGARIPGLKVRFSWEDGSGPEARLREGSLKVSTADALGKRLAEGEAYEGFVLPLLPGLALLPPEGRAPAWMASAIGFLGSAGICAAIAALIARAS
jgi:hypothetical protein